MLRFRVASAPGRQGSYFDQSPSFTLVEMLVSLAILLLVLVIVASMVSQTGSVWRRTVGRVEQFREARDGFEAITRRMSQATLNTYWDYDNPNQPTKYIRQSELRFISGPGIAGTSASVPPRPTHSIFFQAPLGFVVPTSGTDTTWRNYTGLENLLNTWGYYIEYNSDTNFRPSYLTIPPRTRFRLMEYMEPRQSFSLYQLEANTPAGPSTPAGNASYNMLYNSGIGTAGATGTWAWFLNGVNWFVNGNTNVSQTAPVHILAENVVALVLLPKLTPAQEASLSAAAGKQITDTSLAADYYYDSTGYDPTRLNHMMATVSDTGALSYLDPINQLPPIVQVTMVAIDEASAIRLGAQGSQNILNALGGAFSNSNNYSNDLSGPVSQASPNGGIETYLQSMRVNYRVFTTDVSIKGAKWSIDQSQ